MTLSSPASPATPSVRIAIYDMDKTITHAPTWTPFLLHTARRGGSPWRLALVPFAGVAALGYVGKLISRGRLKYVMQRMLLGKRMSAADERRAADAFADRVLRDGVFASARTQIEADRAAGYRLVMATASYRFYVEAIARRLDFDAVIGTESLRDGDGVLLAGIEGENCYGPAKLRMIEAWMDREGIAREDAHVRFYSDHVSDAPTFNWADEPFAVNAHGPLRLLATAKGWPMPDWER
ncbi:HAD family hydrolase [Sphingomonas faeni]|uniref:HAD family hydrolase n=1 Tax=Sphingomonas faeni TaxID=185950 RepID=UPI0027872894|nr:HAD-IB family hydrolase [Sphingomonas faeni]MDQ0838409.1 HAD superfamily hydrolase (TIGR01490 family) [Sphingomonas faeni]